jgi:hypothetical protein
MEFQIIWLTVVVIVIGLTIIVELDMIRSILKEKNEKVNDEKVSEAKKE